MHKVLHRYTAQPRRNHNKTLDTTEETEEAEDWKGGTWLRCRTKEKEKPDHEGNARGGAKRAKKSSLVNNNFTGSNRKDRGASAAKNQEGYGGIIQPLRWKLARAPN